MTALQDQLDEITANTRNLVQAERMAVGETAVRELFESGIEEKILPVGAAAPEFALPDATATVIRSADLLALGPLVINSSAGAGALTASPNSKPGASCIPGCARAARCWPPSARKPSARATSW